MLLVKQQNSKSALPSRSGTDRKLVTENYELKQAIHAQSPDTDPYYVNMAIWHLYELLRERDNEQKQEKIASTTFITSNEPIENKIIPTFTN